jgi:hypothetical protein
MITMASSLHPASPVLRMTDSLTSFRDSLMRSSTFRRIGRAAVLALFLPASVAAQTADVFIVLQTDPDATPGSFSFTHDFGANSNPQVPSPFSLGDGRLQVFNTVTPGRYSVTQQTPEGWVLAASGDGYDTGCWDDQSNSTIDIASGVATIDLGPGEFVVCTFVIREDVDPPVEVDPTSSFTPKGLGYWKNSGKCLKSQDQVTGIADGDQVRLLESQLLGGSAVYPVGSITAMTCQEAARILDKSDLTGDKKANDAAYNLGAHLLAAKLNKAAGAFVPPCVANDMATAQSLLVQLGFTGMGDYLGPATSMRALRTTALRLGGTLAGFNGGRLQDGNCT